jgi:hypothetical protein
MQDGGYGLPRILLLRANFGDAYFSESAASMALAAASPMPGSTCEYLSMVIAIELWPRSSWTTRLSTQGQG